MNLRIRAAIALAMVTVLSTGPLLAQVPSKEELHSQLVSLQAQIDSAKVSGSASLPSLLAQFHNLSAQLGGDQPAATGGAALPRAPRVVPTAPAQCTPSTTNFAQTTPTAIPTGPAVVTSTVLVSGAGPFLWDVDLTTNLTHTFAADLDITLMSPAGTIVTLTTDNGAGNDNVFNGSLWDDDADADGQVPYTTNDGMVTDGAYVNLTTETPIVAEEDLAAFVGEDPNGTWTITISDDLTGDGGSLDSWNLGITTFPAAPINTTVPTVTQGTPTAIPTGPAVVTSTVVVAGAATSLCDLNLTTNLTHTFAADLDITLMSPAGTVVTLTTDNGAGNDNVWNGTVWDDDANPAGQVPYVTNNGLVTDHAYVNLTLASPLVPEEALGAFLGEDPNGTWTITISDDLAGDGGSLDSWSLNITTCECPSADVSITKTDGLTDAAPGQATTYTIVVSNAGPSMVATAAVADAFPAAFTGAIWTCIGAGGGTCTANGAGNIAENVSLPSGGSVTFTVNGMISGAFFGVLTNTATVGTGAIPDPVPGNNSATDNTNVASAASITGTKSVAGTFEEGGAITYTVVLTNSSASAQLDNPGDEFTDILPAGVTLTGASATSGTATPVGNTVTWNGSIPGNGSVTITIDATIDAATAGLTISNQGSFSFDADGNGTNESTGTTDDPAAGGAADPTDLVVGLNPNVLEIPTVSHMGLALLALMLVGFGFTMIRRRG